MTEKKPEEPISKIESSQESLVELKTELRGKLTSMALATFTPGLEDIFYPANTTPKAEPTYPPNFSTLNISKLVFVYDINNDKAGLIAEREREMLTMFLSMHPNAQELEESLGNAEKIRKLFLQPDVKRDVRTMSLVLDNGVYDLLLIMGNSNFSAFIEMIKSKNLPSCLTSDAEMKRLHVVFQENSIDFIRRGLDYQKKHEDIINYVPSSYQVSGDSAREEFVNLCLGDNGKIKSDLNLSTVIQTLNAAYPQD